MANTVFILGAGASKLAGVPLMDDFLDVARDLLILKKSGEYEENFKAVFEGIGKLQLVHSKSQLDIQNIESVFAAFEMAKTLGRFSNYSTDQIDFLVKSMQLLILGTIDKTFKVPLNHRSPKAPEPYGDFANQIFDALQNKQSIAVITFNYDLALDLAFHLRGIPIRYGLQNNEKAIDLPLLKLHGSLNWARCATCDAIVPWYLKDYFTGFHWDYYMMGRETGWGTMGIDTHMKSFSHGDHPVQKEPLIVPPTWNKSGHYALIAPVWALAAKELAEAENIFVIGYSLPQTDIFFRLLYAIGTVGDAPLKRFWVFNPDESGETESRFRSMLGPGAFQRYKYFPQKFENSLGDIFGAINPGGQSIIGF